MAEVDLDALRQVKLRLIMLESFLSRAALIFLSSALTVLGVACSENKQISGVLRNQQSVVSDNVAVSPTVEPTKPPTIPKSIDLSPPALEPSSFELGLDKAVGAVSISQSAQSPEDWNLVANHFRDAIAFMERVERRSSDFAIAQNKISEYKRQVRYALQKANPNRDLLTQAKPQKVVVVVPQPSPTPQITIPVPPPGTGELPTTRPIFSASEKFTPETDVFVAPIKRRVGGTPIVEVMFNGQQRFDMIIDTGASGTVITQEMANALGVVVVGKAKANTASSKAVEFSIGYVDSMEVSGVVVNKVPVAIAGVELETGLLGHDFFGNYDVTIKRNVVEFRPQLRSEINFPETALTPPISSNQYHSVKSP